MFAFADDVGIALRNVARQLGWGPGLAQIRAKATALRLNPGKCQIVVDVEAEGIRTHADQIPGFEAVEVAGKGEVLAGLART